MHALVIRMARTMAFALVGALLFSASLPAQADTIDEAKVEAIIERLLLEKPELVIDAIRTFQAREKAAEESRQREQLSAQKDTLFDNPDDPAIGNPNAAVTVVEFFDYRCGYCKRSLQTVLDLVKRNPDVRVVFKEFPILGEDSMRAARVSLAVHKVSPEQYGEFHEKAMRHRGSLSESALVKIAAGLGVDADAVEKAINDPSIQEAIVANYALAEALNIRGTPAFVIGDTVLPGAVDLQTLEKLIAEERG